jgi:hypothetical protein
MGNVNITFGNETVGSIAFTQPGVGLNASRTAAGFRLQIPAAMRFSAPSGSGLPLTLENLRAIFFADHAGKQTEIGSAPCDSIFFTPVHEAPITFSWDWTMEAFAFYENLRAGTEPKFRLQVCGDIRYILVPDGRSRTGKEACSSATRFYQWGEVGYSQKVWTKMMRDLNLQDSILVEIPFPSDPPTGWEPIWAGLRDARDSFDAGGSTGWKNSITSVRLALDEWRKIEKEDQGPGWQSPKNSDLHSRTKEQRIDNIRWHLIQLAHYAAHTKADDWTRDDALLMLSTLSSLLAVRKP